jgi:ketosteroid isomerase-like protein
VSEANVEIVRRFYDAWAQGVYPGPDELMDPEIEYVNPAGAIEPGVRRGVPAFARAVEKTLDAWELWAMQVHEARAVGDQVVVEVSYRARGRGSGVEIEGRESALWTVRDGRVVRYEWFHEAGDAQAAAETRE